MNDDIITYREIQKKQLLTKLRSYCDYQERCHKDVSDKLLKLNADEDLLNEIISELIKDGYLNEERYVCAYVSGKHRINKWGRNKITTALKQKNITQYLIDKGLEEIDEDDYLMTLKSLMEGKIRTTKFKNHFDKYNKIFSFVYRKGYESELIKAELEGIIN
jgi:regulatory protein